MAWFLSERPSYSFLQALLLALCVIVFIVPSTALAQDSTLSTDDAPTPGWRYEFQRKYELFRDYGHDWRLGILFGLNSEDGLILGAGPILYHFGFRTFPCVSRMELTGGISSSTARYKVAYEGLWPALSQHTSFELKTHVSQLEVRNFYGFGNESQRDEQREEDGFYRVSPQEYFARGILSYRLNGSSSVGLGALVRDFSVGTNTNRYLSGGSSTLASVGAVFVVDARDHPMAPHGGMYLRVEGWNTWRLRDNLSSFQKVMGDVRFYYGDTVLTDIMVGVRFHGEVLNGTRFPFFEAAFLGGAGSLRGFSAQRFAGDAMAFANTEIRFSVGRWFIVVPTEVGLFLLCDAGRVWMDGDSPGGLHTDTGAGIWLAPLSRDFIISLGLASSIDGVFAFGGVGFGF